MSRTFSLEILYYNRTLTQVPEAFKIRCPLILVKNRLEHRSEKRSEGVEHCREASAFSGIEHTESDIALFIKVLLGSSSSTAFWKTPDGIPRAKSTLIKM